MQGRIPAWLTRAEDWLWAHESQQHHPLTRRFWHACRILFAVVRDLAVGPLTLHAMGLVYTTLLSIVPLLALSFSVLKALGVHNQLEPLLHNLMEPLGEQSEHLVTGVLSFVDNIQVGVLGWVGLCLLIFTVVSLIQKVERSFNEIWRVARVRPVGQRFASYLSVVVIGPVLVVSAMGMTTTLVGSDLVQSLVVIEPFGRLFAFMTKAMPYVLIITLFTFVYLFLPNTRVQLRYALIGGVVAGLTWQSAIYGFTRFVVNSNYEAVYSGFAVGILLLIWLYVAWLILLLGSCVAFYAQHARQITRERVVRPSARLDEHLGLGLLYRVARQFDRTGGATDLAELETQFALDPDNFRRLVSRLVEGKVLCPAGHSGESLMPARSLDQISLAAVLEIIRSATRHSDFTAREPAAVLAITEQIQSRINESLGELTVQDWVRSTEPLEEILSKPAATLNRVDGLG